MEEVDSDSVCDAPLGKLQADVNSGGVSAAPGALPSYTLVDAIREADVSETAFVVMVYDPEGNKFIVHYSEKQG